MVSSGPKCTSSFVTYGYFFDASVMRAPRAPAPACASSLHVRKLLRHPAVAHAEHVGATDVPRLAVALPVVDPARHAPVADGDHLLGLEPRLGRAREERLPECAHRRLALEALAGGLRPRVL